MLTNKQKDKIDEKKASLAPALKRSEDVDYTEGGNGQWKKGAIPPLWDGHAAERIVNILCSL